MRKLIAISVFFISFLAAFGQRQANHWFFGDSISLEFRVGGVVVTSKSAMYAPEGCATASDSLGNLLFYSNGKSVWNRQHLIMSGGDSLFGEPDVTQSVLCLPEPGFNPRFWYLFTNSPYTHRKLSYVLIDMQAGNGLGAVVSPHTDLMQGPSERMTAVNHCNGRDVWIIAHRQSNNRFYAFLLKPEGIVAQPVVSDLSLPYDMNGSGYLKASPSGSYLAMGMRAGNVVLALLQFNNETGEVSDPLLISTDGLHYCYGLAFSHDSRRLYAGFGGEQYRVMQYDLTHKPWSDLASTGYRVSLGNNYAFQEAPDGRIYVAQVNGSWLGCILHPGELGARCDFVPNHLFIGQSRCRMGLPSFNQSLFYRPSLENKHVCELNPLVLSLPIASTVDSITWHPDWVENPWWTFTTTVDSLVFSYYAEGTYQIAAVLWHCGTSDTAFGLATVALTPEVNLGADTVLFDGQSIFLQLNDVDSCLWGDGLRESGRLVNQPGLYSVTAWSGVCSNTDSLLISTRSVPVFIPNVFTPNGNGANDVWRPVVPSETSYTIQVFDRFGARVAEIVPGSVGWDGNVGGKPCAEGIYIWVLNRPPDPLVYGSVLVIR
ncbi:MAG: hypothetical protein CVU06_00970 [Bacteroidetes bacterium HGW-Bacteroidetes-22]|nr:MAG: hypothetical protein CVU06_00970 [Bacteroidetes bacterium HGW-Bacteroidetes-22]